MVEKTAAALENNIKFEFHNAYRFRGCAESSKLDYSKYDRIC